MEASIPPAVRRVANNYNLMGDVVIAEAIVAAMTEIGKDIVNGDTRDRFMNSVSNGYLLIATDHCSQEPEILVRLGTLFRMLNFTPGWQNLPQGDGFDVPPIQLFNT